MDVEPAAAERGFRVRRFERDREIAKSSMRKSNTNSPHATRNWSLGNQSFKLGSILITKRTRITRSNKRAHIFAVGNFAEA